MDAPAPKPVGFWRGWVCGLAPAYVALWVYGAGWTANATWPSECGNCRPEPAARQSLMWEVPWLMAVSVGCCLGAAGWGRPVARCGTAVGLAVWAVSLWLGRGWWW